ncbi:unnamed protein product [Clavelina lepadiformis]|uniref:Uncharacterized protein n=1 Tax=Clavelina lepadiformis TaxID=159417 RepID=A0ABP0G720_CLALP
MKAQNFKADVSVPVDSMFEMSSCRRLSPDTDAPGFATTIPGHLGFGDDFADDRLRWHSHPSLLHELNVLRLAKKFEIAGIPFEDAARHELTLDEILKCTSQLSDA